MAGAEGVLLAETWRHALEALRADAHRRGMRVAQRAAETGSVVKPRLGFVFAVVAGDAGDLGCDVML
jgi:hypothetical protein